MCQLRQNIKRKVLVKRKKHPGEPLKRKDEDWDTAIGPSSDAIPSSQLPGKRVLWSRGRPPSSIRLVGECCFQKVNLLVPSEGVGECCG